MSSLSLVDQGKKALDAGRFEKAEELFNRVVQQEPRNAEAWVLLGEASSGVRSFWLGKRFPDRVCAAFDAAIGCDPDLTSRPGMAARLGRAYLGAELWALAQRMFEIALQKNHTDKKALVGLGRALTGLKKYDDAIRILDDVLKIDKHFEEARSVRMDAADKRFNQTATRVAGGAAVSAIAGALLKAGYDEYQRQSKGTQNRQIDTSEEHHSQRKPDDSNLQ